MTHVDHDDHNDHDNHDHHDHHDHCDHYDHCEKLSDFDQTLWDSLTERLRILTMIVIIMIVSQGSLRIMLGTFRGFFLLF